MVKTLAATELAMSPLVMWLGSKEMKAYGLNQLPVSQRACTIARHVLTNRHMEFIMKMPDLRFSALVSTKSTKRRTMDAPIWEP